MALYILLYMLHVIPVYSQIYHHTSNAVFNHGVPDLGKEIKQNIKTFVGPHSYTLHHHPLAPAQSKGYEVIEHEPIIETQETKETKKSKAHGSEKSKKHKKKGKEYHEKGEKKSSGHHSDHHHESKKKGHSDKENKNKKYKDETGKKTQYEDKDVFSKGHHEEGKGGGGHGFKNGKLRDKGHVHKGFHDVYHKDEKKKVDSFWSNHEETGKWYKYGSHKHDHHDGDGHKKSGKHEKESKEEDKYKKEKCTKCKKN